MHLNLNVTLKFTETLMHLPVSSESNDKIHWHKTLNLIQVSILDL